MFIIKIDTFMLYPSKLYKIHKNTAKTFKLNYLQITICFLLLFYSLS